MEPASDSESPDPSTQRAMAALKRAQGDEFGALAHLIAAHALQAHATSGAAAGSGAELCNVATGYFMKGEHDAAARWYRLALALDPNQASAWQNLAAIHAKAGRAAQAQLHRERAYRLQRVFVEGRSDAAARRVLILCVGHGSGNVPFDTLLPGAACRRIKYAIDYAAPEEDTQLAAFDLVFNAIGDADIAAPLADRLAHFAQHCSRPLLNPPAAIERTRRDRLAELLHGLDEVAVAPCLRCPAPPASRAELLERLAGGGIGLPVLARPAAAHGGAGLTRCDTIEALARDLSTLDGAHYLTQFCDSRSADGYYRKYRFIFVDREPFAYHLAISRHWMVHYFSAGMENPEDPDDPRWKIAEEQRFLEDPGSALGARAMAAVAAIGRRLELDYAGIDCALLPDGRVLVFEANATMLVHRERRNGPLAHKNAHVQRIVDAFEQLQQRRCTTAGRAA